MKKLISKMKLFHLILLVFAGLVIISALPFKTQYANIYVNVSTKIEDAGSLDPNGSGVSQVYLFDFFERVNSNEFVDNNNNVFKNDFNEYKVHVYEFENDLNDLNNYILVFGIIVFIGVAILYLFGNNNRKIYYTSNMLASTIFTLVAIGMSIGFLVWSFSIMGRFTQESNLYNYVSVLQNPDVNIQAFKSGSAGDIEYVKGLFDCNVITFIVYDLFVALFMAYTVFMFILSLTKYNATAERRRELEKVVAAND